MKLLNNYVMLAGRVATSEATVRGRQVGLDMETMLEVFNASSGHNSATDRVFPNYIATGTYDKGSVLSLLDKDIHLAMAFAEEEGMPMMLGETVNQLLSYSVSDQGPDADSSRLHTFFERMMTGTEE
jgi:3-hydroxyisobutyrate dehydrogenase-like beta-hydroxyacid dehydrogenase